MAQERSGHTVPERYARSFDSAIPAGLGAFGQTVHVTARHSLAGARYARTFIAALDMVHGHGRARGFRGALENVPRFRLPQKEQRGHGATSKTGVG